MSFAGFKKQWNKANQVRNFCYCNGIGLLLPNFYFTSFPKSVWLDFDLQSILNKPAWKSWLICQVYSLLLLVHCYFCYLTLSFNSFWNEHRLKIVFTLEIAHSYAISFLSVVMYSWIRFRLYFGLVYEWESWWCEGDATWRRISRIGKSKIVIFFVFLKV